MYLLYDVIQRRKSALGNSLFVKRGDYEEMQQIISSLNFDQLIAAAQSLRSMQTTSDPAIAVLRRAVQTVAARVPNSFAEKQEMRLYLRGLFIEFGPAAFWLTINPSDLRDPLVIKLAGVTIPEEGLQKANAAFRRKTANMNPAAIAIFFDRLCTAILKGLVCPGEGQIGIFGEVSTYFGAVETNGRGMLHLHCLVWLAGNLDFFGLRRKMLNDPSFAGQVVDYLDLIISESIDLHESEGKPDEMALPSTSNFDTDEEYVDALHKYGNAVASKRQRHSKNHNSTCFKYCRQGARACRFYFPRPKVEASHIDDLGVAHLRRDDEWVNPYNPWIAAAIGSNQDLSFLATRAKALALLYYITNYATKDEASTYQMVMTAAMMRKTLEQAGKASDPSDAERIALEKGMRNFSLRVFNRMSHDKEVSGVKVASSLLQLPGYYTPPTELRRINLYYLRRRFQTLIQRSDDEEGTLNEEQVTINLNRNFRASVFDDYRWRSSGLKDLCLYEYIKVIKKREAEHRTGGDLDFDIQHPEQWTVR
jgi:Helitron helicase-like domain at N-terminus